MSFHHHGNPCGCQPRRIVHPVKHNCVHCCSESVVEHIHPEHTTIMNHHVVKNKHVFPKTASVQNSCSNVNVYGGSPQMPAMQDPGYGQGHHHGSHHHGHHHMQHSHQHGHHHGHHPHQGQKWC
ncbi:CotD family spore coat protein [Virgibacillus halophilus]|uniref:CotD family spore coat protein n=1 Tax=Tigheibacillus halophilus TaxID=361280 RepID=A0ABU5CAJ8_9BACI|nr:CotD family spore coat protein [Virgibacillus halophilus]